MVYKSTENDEFIVTCDCGCSGLRFKMGVLDFGNNNIEDREMYISLVTSEFYNGQNNIWLSFFEKCKRIWCVIANKEYYYAEVALTPTQWKDFKKAVNKIK